MNSVSEQVLVMVRGVFVSLIEHFTDEFSPDGTHRLIDRSEYWLSSFQSFFCIIYSEDTSRVKLFQVPPESE